MNIKSYIGAVLLTAGLVTPEVIYAIGIRVDFSVTDFIGGAVPPDDPVSGTIIYEAASTTADIESLQSISLTIDGYTYSVGEVGFISPFGAGPVKSIVGATIFAVNAISNNTNDFWLSWDKSGLTGIHFSFASAVTSGIWDSSTFTSFSVSPLGVDTVGDVGEFSSLVLDVDGYPVVSYFDFTNRDLKVMHCNDADCAGGDESITSPDTMGKVGYWTSLALDDSGYPVVSYWDDSNGDLKILHCNDANCAGGDESITNPDNVGFGGGGYGLVGVYISLALDADGYPVVSYYDSPNGDLKILHCNDANCAGGDESITRPDTVADVGLYTSLALDVDGYPVVSYFDFTNRDLKVMHCNDADCAGDDESITSPNTAGDVGLGTSLALDANGYPVVSYFDVTNRDLKVMHCNDANCTGGDENITSPDTAGDVGYWTSLALDSSGHPVVSYYDSTNGDLKLIHCSDSNDACPGVPGNTPEGSHVSVHPVDEGTGEKPVQLFFDEVTTEGNTVVSTSSTGPETPFGFTDCTPKVFYDINTTALFEGNITLCFDEDAGCSNDPVLAHYRNGIDQPPVSLETYIVSDGFVCAVTDTLSVFAFYALDSDGDGVPNDQDACLGSDLSDTVVIDGCDSGVENTLFGDGCTIADLVNQCGDAKNHGKYVSCVSHLTNGLKKEGLLSGKEKGATQRCAAQADIP